MQFINLLVSNFSGKRGLITQFSGLLFSTWVITDAFMLYRSILIAKNTNFRDEVGFQPKVKLETTHDASSPSWICSYQG